MSRRKPYSNAKAANAASYFHFLEDEVGADARELGFGNVDRGFDDQDPDTTAKQFLRNEGRI